MTHHEVIAVWGVPPEGGGRGEVDLELEMVQADITDLDGGQSLTSHGALHDVEDAALTNVPKIVDPGFADGEEVSFHLACVSILLLPPLWDEVTIPLVPGGVLDVISHRVGGVQVHDVPGYALIWV